MFKRSSLIVILLLVISSLAIGIFYASKQLERLPKLDEVFLQKQIDKVLVTKGEGKKGKIDYKVRSANIQISDEAKLSFAIDLKGYGFTGDVIANVSGSPVYNRSKKAFYFKPSEEIEFERLQIDGKFKPKGILGKIASKSKFVKDVMDDNDLVKDVVSWLVSKYLTHMPVYKISKDKLTFKVIGIALNKVEIKGGEILIDISFWQLTKTVLLFIFAIVLAFAMTFAIILNPSALGGLVAAGALS